MDQSTADFIKEKLKPHLDEVFDGYVVLGYARDNDGNRNRLVLFNNLVKPDGSCPDAAIADGLKPALAVARTWASGQL